MKTGIQSTAVALLASLVLIGCSDKEEEPQITAEQVEAAADSAAKEAAAASQAESDKAMGDKLATGLANIKADSEEQLAAAKQEMEEKLATNKAAMEADLSEKLAEQAAMLKQQYEASNGSLQAQLNSLTSKYTEYKDKLPASITEPFQEKLPKLEASVETLENLVSKFSPSTLEQVEEFKTEYSKELQIAKNIADELLSLLGKSSYTELIPKFENFKSDAK